MSACAAKSSSPAPPPAPLFERPNPAPYCKIEGCCQNHGGGGYLQPDKLIICADGQPSEICDCH
jgi:hypothetical protein